MAGGSFAILTVCSGNICRSPMAEQLLRTGLSSFAEVELASAGTVGLVGHGMEPQSQELSLRYGGTNPDLHRARYLTEQIIRESSLLFAMSREHRRAIVELVPRAIRTTFTIREFARLSSVITDEQLANALRTAEAADLADSASADPAGRADFAGRVARNERIETSASTDPLDRLRALAGNRTPSAPVETGPPLVEHLALVGHPPLVELVETSERFPLTARFAAAVDLVASMRGQVAQPLDAEDDDVIDPYKQSEAIYQRSANELVPAVQATLNYFARAAAL